MDRLRQAGIPLAAYLKLKLSPKPKLVSLSKIATSGRVSMAADPNGRFMCMLDLGFAYFDCLTDNEPDD